MRIAFVAVALGFLLAPSVARAEDIANPEYENWSRFKVGSYVRLEMESEMSGNKTKMETTITLKELSKEKAVIETKGVMEMSGSKMEIPPSTREIPARIKKSDTKPSSKKPVEGDEEIEVGGKTLKCHWTEVDNEQSGMKTHTKTWLSPEVPGGLARMDQTAEGSMKGHTKMWAEKWESK